MKLKFYRHEKCTTCKKAEAFLESHNIDHLSINIVTTPPSKKELSEMLHQVGDIRKMFNTSGQRYRELKLKDKLKELSDEEALDLLSGDGMLIKRPFLLGEDVGLVGFKDFQWEILTK